MQSLFGVGMGLKSCRKLLGDDAPKVSQRMTENLANLNGIIAELHGMLDGFYPEQTVASHSQKVGCAYEIADSPAEKSITLSPPRNAPTGEASIHLQANS